LLLRQRQEDRKLKVSPGKDSETLSPIQNIKTNVIVQVVELLHSMSEALGSICNTTTAWLAQTVKGSTMLGLSVLISNFDFIIGAITNI
jgi:hypothetical protein